MLDATIANLAISDLGSDFGGSSTADLTWVVTLYAVLFAALLGPAGRLADVVGRRRLYVAGVALFTAMSVLCAVAPELWVLLAARGLQGAGAALMIPASLAVLLVDTPAQRRAAAIGMWSAAAAFAAAVGPSVGGVLVDLLGWRSVFLINVPLGLVLLAAAARALPAAVGTRKRLPDVAGTILLGVGIGALVAGLGKGQEWGWGDPLTVSALAIGTLALVSALQRSRTHPVPAVEISLWRTRTFAVANGTSFLYGAALYPWMLVGVFVLTESWGYSPLEAGLALSPGALSAAVAAMLAGRLPASLGPRAAVMAGGLTMAATATWVALAVEQTPAFWSLWLPAGLIGGAGMGAVTWGASSAAALSVAPARFAGATGLNVTARQVGGALGVAALAAFVAANTADALDGYRLVYLFAAVASLGAAGLGALLAPATRPATAAAPAATAAGGAR